MRPNGELGAPGGHKRTSTGIVNDCHVGTEK